MSKHAIIHLDCSRYVGCTYIKDGLDCSGCVSYSKEEGKPVRPNFFVVWRELGNGEVAAIASLNPRVKHDTEESARTEAARLAAIYPRSKFHVLAQIASCKANSVTWE